MNIRVAHRFLSMFHPIFVNYMEQQIINNGESGLSVRNKINGMFASLISGSEGVNAIWKQIGANLNYTAEIGNVETLNATSKAWGEIYITGKKFVFNFGIPQGYDGGMIIIRKTYSSVAEMNADKNPMGDDGIAIGGGQIVSVFNSSNPDENAFYSRTANGWKMQLGVVKEFRDEMKSQVDSVKQEADKNKANIQSLINALQKQIGTQIGTIGGYFFMGIATPTTDPGEPSFNAAYLAVEAGTYDNFKTGVVVAGEQKKITLTKGQSVILKYNGFEDSPIGWFSQDIDFSDVVTGIVKQKFVTQEEYDKLTDTGKIDNDTCYNILEE